jgi:hypothetical protein
VPDLTQKKPKPQIQKYGYTWDPAFTDDLMIEMEMIRHNGCLKVNGQTYGKGLFYHFREAQSLLWPEDDHHRWSDLMLETMCEQRITVVQGSRDTGKTHGISKWGLVDYWSEPEITMTLVSSTGMRELELRVWGDIKDLFRRAQKRYPYLPGKVADKSFGIFTDLLEDTGDIRDMRKGLVCVPCLGGDGEWIGMERYVGIKQKRRRLLGDEMQFMHAMYVNVLDAMDKGDFKGCFVGNPIGGNGKALDKIAEPRAGWSSLGDVTETRCWPNKYGGVTVNLVGTDSPNFDKDTLNKFPYLINQTDVDRVGDRNGRDSAQFWTLIMGVRKTGVDAYRVLTVEMCERHGAFNTAVWSGTTRTKVYAVDAGFGGDPCVVVVCEFGEDVVGRQVIEFSEPKVIPISISGEISPEDQIALYIRADCERLEIPDTNVFYDAGMRATLPVSLGRIMSSRTNAVNFGGPATDRPVSEDLFTIDVKTRERRPLKCNEQYSKFVTELHYSMREVVEAKQCRALPRKVAEEFAMREWHWVPGPLGQRYELETKAEFKKRQGGESPNDSDATSIGLEGARRLGFSIKNPKEHRAPESAQREDWLERELESYRKFVKGRELSYK